jgi:hypothetical protein
MIRTWLNTGVNTMRAAANSTGRTFREFGPYALMELLLPGGSVIALSLWLWRRGRPAGTDLKARISKLCAE